MAKQYRPLDLLEGVQLSVSDGAVKVKGKLGTIDLPVGRGLTVQVDGKQVRVAAEAEIERAMIGTLRALIRNAIVGVATGYEKVLQVRGMGYRTQKTNDGIQIQCGYSHPVDVAAPPGIAMEIKSVPNPDDTKQQMFEISVRGIDLQVVGEVAARIRAIKPAEPYKGKGIRYRGEFIRKKAGKRAVGAQG